MNSKTQIALFLPSLVGGGAERVMVNLARGFAQRGIVVDVVLSKAEGPYLAEVPSYIRVVDLGAAKVITGLPALIDYLRDKQPEALLSTLTYANIVAVWAKMLARVRTRVVIREANTMSRASQGASDFRDRLLPFLARSFYAFADGIVTVSEGAASDLSRTAGLPFERITVLPNPVITPEVLALAKEPLQDSWFAPGSASVILGVGRLSKQKDFPTLIRAFAAVRQQRLCRLVILGEGEERPRLETLITTLGLQESVALLGFVKNPFAYMSRSRVFVLCSAWEGLPGVLIQAMACGAPIISTDCESGPRQILHDGRFGQLVPVADVPALTNALLIALDQPRYSAPREAWAAFTQDTAVDSYLQTLRAQPELNERRQFGDLPDVVLD